MLHQREAMAAHEAAVREATGKNFDSFSQKINWLQKKWTKATDSEEARLISPLLSGNTTPINIAIIADNLEYFEKHKEAYEKDVSKALNRACLCGSQQVAEFLLKELKLNYLSEGCDYLLSYVSASPNIEWAKEIAIAMAKAEKTLPNEIFALASDKTIDIIQKIFQEKNAQGKNEVDDEKTSISKAPKPETK